MIKMTRHCGCNYVLIPGQIGPTGPTGPAGSGGDLPSASCYSDYLFWNENNKDWEVGSTEVHLGCNAGVTQGLQSVAIGNNAGNQQGTQSVAIGTDAGSVNQGGFAIAIGQTAGQTNQQNGTIAIGTEAGLTDQQIGGIAIGSGAASNTQQSRAIAIGVNSGETTQQSNAIAIGFGAANQNQQGNGIAIGTSAAFSNQQPNAIAIGNNAGPTSQGANSIAIGLFAGNPTQAANSIALNASGSGLAPATNGFFARPIRTSTDALPVLMYNDGTYEIVYSIGENAKTFVINHPLHKDKYLVHACLEGPEAGVYYRGEVLVDETQEAVVILPDYVDSLATDFTIQLTSIRDGKKKTTLPETSRVEKGQFTVYAESGSYFWTVYGKRLTIDVEPSKEEVVVKGDGPYTWI